MCLSQVARIEQVDTDSATATVTTGGRTKRISLVVLALEGDLPVAGDWVQVSTGLAVRRLTDAEATRILSARMEAGSAS